MDSAEGVTSPSTECKMMETDAPYSLYQLQKDVTSHLDRHQLSCPFWIGDPSAKLSLAQSVYLSMSGGNRTEVLHKNMSQCRDYFGYHILAPLNVFAQCLEKRKPEGAVFVAGPMCFALWERTKRVYPEFPP